MRTTTFLRAKSAFSCSISYYYDNYPHPDYPHGIEGTSKGEISVAVGDLFECSLDDAWIYLDDDGDGNIYLNDYLSNLEEVELTHEEVVEIRSNNRVWYQG
jgi:hypothetical protein